MEIQSPVMPKALDPHRIPSSIKQGQNHSGLRYTPTHYQEERSITLLELFQDSLEIPRPKSRLIEFPDATQPCPKDKFDLQKSINAAHSKKSSLSFTKPSSVTEMLINLREKPKPKSNLKHSVSLKKQKTVSFCSQIDLSSPDTLVDSVVYLGSKQILEDSLEIEPEKSTLATATNSLIQDNSGMKMERNSDTTVSTQQNLDIIDYSTFDCSKKFSFEEAVKQSAIREVEFSEFSTIAYCAKCEKETVTEVGFEKVKGQSCIDITEWIICWVMPACMYRRKMIVHKCAFCKEEIFKAEV